MPADAGPNGSGAGRSGESEGAPGNLEIEKKNHPLIARWWANIKSTRLKLNKKLHGGRLGSFLDVFNTLLSLGHCGLFSSRTYYEFESSPEAASAMFHLNTAVLIVCWFLAFDFFVRWFASENWYRFVMTRNSFLEGFTIVPALVLTTQVRVQENNASDPTSFRWVLRQTILFRFVRVFKLMKYFASADGNAGEVKRQMVSVCMTLATIIYLFASLFYVCESFMVDPEEKESQWGVKDLVFHDAIYYAVVTVTSVGYGDFRPLSWLGKLLVVCTVAFTIIVIPAQTNQLLALMSIQSPYARASYTKKGKARHVIVCGHITAVNAKGFCEEFFHEDHGMADAHVVFLCPEVPNGQMELLVHSRSHQITYLQGSPLVEADLTRALATGCEAVILLCDNLRFDAQAEDSGTILRALAMRKYLFLNPGASEIPIILELRKPGSKHHFQTSAFGGSGKNSNIICMDEIRLNLIAKSCLCPGFSTMISNLVMSSSIELDEDFPNPWAIEYAEGCGLEIYRTVLSPKFRKMPFIKVAQLIYDDLQCTVFAIEVKAGNKSKIVINPAEYEIVQRNSHVFVLAGDQEAADKISEWGLDTKGKRRMGRERQKEADMSLHGITPRFSSAGTPNSLLKAISTRKIRDDFASVTSHVKNSMLGITRDMSMCSASIGDSDNNHTEYSNETLLNMKRKVISMYDNPVSLEECTRRDVQDMSGHVLLCGESSSMSHFIATLRPKHLAVQLPIVILRPEMTVYDWDSQCAFYKDVYYVQGYPQKPQDLVRAGVKTASRAVILSPSCKETNEVQGLARDMDTRVVFVYQAIMKANPNIHIVCEIILPGSVPFLNMEQAATRTNDVEVDEVMFSDKFQPPFASGNVYFSSNVMDLLACQAFFNPHLITILQELVVLNPESASISDLTQAPSELFFSPIPESFFKGERTYGELFKYLTTEEMAIPLGLYRRYIKEDETTKSSPLTKKSKEGASATTAGQSQARYVITAPPSDLGLRQDDHIYLLKVPERLGGSPMGQASQRGVSCLDSVQEGKVSKLAPPVSPHRKHQLNGNLSDDALADMSPISTLDRSQVVESSGVFNTIRDIDRQFSNSGVGNGELRQLRDELRSMLSG